MGGVYMKYTIPKRIDVFGVRYKVKFVETQMFSGLCDPAVKTIFINIDQTDDQLLATFFHEAFHAMQFSLGMENALSREMMEMLAENSSTLVIRLLKLK